MCKLNLEKGRRTRDQIANIHWIIEKTREIQKNIYFCFTDYAKAFDYVNHSKLWKILREMGIADHLTCLLRNLYAHQEATVRTRQGTRDWFKTGKRVYQGCILSSCLFNLYAEYITQNAKLDGITSWNQDCRGNVGTLGNCLVWMGWFPLLGEMSTTPDMQIISL